MDNKIELENTEQQIRDNRWASVRKFTSALFTYLGYAVIIIVFVTPFLYVIGNSVRNSQQIWANAYPISWRSFPQRLLFRDLPGIPEEKNWSLLHGLCANRKH